MKPNSAKVAILALSVFVSLATSFSAEASGSKAGNGGHGVKCGAGRTELLDLYEAREFYGIQYQGNFFDSTEQEIARLQADMTMILGPDDSFLTIFNDARFLLQSLELKRGYLALTPDAGFIAGELPKECRLEQLAVRGVYVTQHIYVTVSEADWQMMLSTERALLMLHEAAHERFSWYSSEAMPSTLAIRQLIGMMSGPLDYKIKKAEVIRKLIRTQTPAFTNELRP